MTAVAVVAARRASRRTAREQAYRLVQPFNDIAIVRLNPLCPWTLRQIVRTVYITESNGARPRGLERPSSSGPQAGWELRRVGRVLRDPRGLCSLAVGNVNISRSNGTQRRPGGNSKGRRTLRRFGSERICHNKRVRTDLLEEVVWQDARAMLENPQRVERGYPRGSGNRRASSELCRLTWRPPQPKCKEFLVSLSAPPPPLK